AFLPPWVVRKQILVTAPDCAGTVPALGCRCWPFHFRRMSISNKTKKSTKSEPVPQRRATDQPLGAMKAAIIRHLTYTLARDQGTATPRDWWIATAMAVRDRILDRMIETQSVHNDRNVRRLYYLSLEYLMGR